MIIVALPKPKLGDETLHIQHQEMTNNNKEFLRGCSIR